MKPAAAVLLSAALLPAPALLALHFSDGPPARVTGGYGEDSCAACHFGTAENDPAGILKISGFPERYIPGGIYDLELSLTDPRMKTAGFQLALRLDTGDTQAGTLALPEAAAGVALQESRGITFAQHGNSKPGIAEGTARWRLVWTAPMVAGDVVLHAAAVAGDGDESQGGDLVYTLTASSERECPCRADE